MHFSHTAPAASSKTTKIATVVAIHVVLGYGLVNSMSTIKIGPKKEEDKFILVDPIKKVEPPKPIEPPKPVEKPAAKPELPVIPAPEVRVETPIESPIAVREVVDPPAEPQPIGQAEPKADPGPANPAQGIRTAVFAEGCAVPEYPTSSLRNQEEGTVVLALMVNAAGKVDTSRVTKSSGFKSLDRAAQQALSLCKFQPAMADGQPQAGWAQISYNWKLDN